MAHHLREILGDMLVVPQPKPGTKHSISPDDLRGKILIKVLAFLSPFFCFSLPLFFSLSFLLTSDCWCLRSRARSSPLTLKMTRCRTKTKAPMVCCCTLRHWLPQRWTRSPARSKTLVGWASWRRCAKAYRIRRRRRSSSRRNCLTWSPGFKAHISKVCFFIFSYVKITPSS